MDTLAQPSTQSVQPVIAWKLKQDLQVSETLYHRLYSNYIIILPEKVSYRHPLHFVQYVIVGLSGLRVMCSP